MALRRLRSVTGRVHQFRQHSVNPQGAKGSEFTLPRNLGLDHLTLDKVVIRAQRHWWSQVPCKSDIAAILVNRLAWGEEVQLNNPKAVCCAVAARWVEDPRRWFDSNQMAGVCFL